jgi:hypothetical protein
MGADGKFKMRKEKRINSEGKEVEREYPIFDPMGKLKFRLENAVASGELTAAQAKRIREVTIPAYSGRLGSTMNPHLRKAVAYGRSYMSVALLSGATLTSLPDYAGLYVRLGAYSSASRSLGGLRTTFKYLTDKGYAKEARAYASTLLSIHDHFIDHSLANSTSLDYQPALSRRINEKFFTVIQLKRWTDFTRIIGVAIAKDDITYLHGQNTKEANEKLARLGLKRKDVGKWIQSGASKNHLTQEQHDMENPAIAIGLNRWVNQAIVRPSAQMRPGRASDHRAAAFWFLNDFMYGYYETIMKQAWTNTKDMKGFGKVVPGLTLAAAVMPLAAVGYELRKLLFGDLPAELLDTKDKTREFYEWDYFWEVYRRSGLLGPVQLLDDAQTDMEYGESKGEGGKRALFGLLGVIPEKIMQAMDDPGKTLFKTTPILAQSPTLRAYVGGKWDDWEPF